MRKPTRPPRNNRPAAPARTILLAAFLMLVLAALPLAACSQAAANPAGTKLAASSSATASTAIPTAPLASLTPSGSASAPASGFPSGSTSGSTSGSAPVPSPSAAAGPSATTRPAASAATSRPKPSPSPKPVPTVTPKAAAPVSLAGHLVVLDPGHQTTPDPVLEPIAPGSPTLKPRTSAGTRGAATGRLEYEINLEIAFKVKARLEAHGCIVHLTRTENDVQMSNIERAQFAVTRQPDAFLRLHCNWNANPDVSGVRVYVPLTGPYAGQVSDWARLLAADFGTATGAINRGITATGTYTGLNWADLVPSFLLEMGYMSNEKEDRLLCDPIYQEKIAAGIERFVARMPVRKRT